MSRYILDTRAFLQVLDDVSGLSEAIKAVLDDKEAVFYVSAASFFEIAVKKALKKVKVPENLDEIAKTCGFVPLPILPEHALRTVRLPYHHTDPFDRLLIAQAKMEDMRVITDNPVFGLYDIDVITM